jgi:hypothetical protein
MKRNRCQRQASTIIRENVDCGGTGLESETTHESEIAVYSRPGVDPLQSNMSSAIHSTLGFIVVVCGVVFDVVFGCVTSTSRA